MINQSAIFSDCGRYRYCLVRQWASGDSVTFIMLNPSTADAKQDDPTIRRCIGFAQREGFGGLNVVNLFAGRATKPTDLFAMDDPIGPENTAHISQLIQSNKPLVAAWGAHPEAQKAFAEVSKAIRFPTMLCLGVSKLGAPRHPLYVRKDAELIEWAI